MRHETQSTVELLKELGLKEYEARVFVALTRVSHGTAREISELADVPRTRVYDAGEQLEERGLVEVRQSKPQCYRAIPVGDAVEVLRRRYGSRFDDLADALAELEASRDPGGPMDGVWSLSGSETIVERATQIIDAAEEEVVVLLGAAASDENAAPALASADPSAGVNTDATGGADAGLVAERARAATHRGVTVYLGSLAPDATTRERVRETIPEARAPGELETWLRASDATAEGIGYLAFADRNELLLSSVADSDGERVETAIRSTDFGNGLLAMMRRLLEAGLAE